MSDELVEASGPAAEAMVEALMEADVKAEIIEAVRLVKVKFGLLGITTGAAAGALIAWNVAYRRASAKYAEISENEIEEMRVFYRAKLVAREEKPSLSALSKQHQKIVDEQGYSDKPPMAVSAPDDVIEAAKETEPPKGASVPLTRRLSEEEIDARRQQEPETRNVFQEAQTEVDALGDDWNYQYERSRRSPIRPYVIHVDEREETSYDEATLTYYEADDVLCRENDEIMDADEREKLIGEQNLERFGHGSNDPTIVYVRNNDIQLDFEIVKSPQAYAEEVAGFKHHTGRENLESMRRRERGFDDDD